MSDERDGIEMLRKAIDDLADRLPARLPGPRPSVVSWVVVAVCVIAGAAIATYRFLPGPTSPAPQASPASLGVEVKLLRILGRDVGARVFDAPRAGTVVVAPDIDRMSITPPTGMLLLLNGGTR